MDLRVPSGLSVFLLSPGSWNRIVVGFGIHVFVWRGVIGGSYSGKVFLRLDEIVGIS